MGHKKQRKKTIPEEQMVTTPAKQLSPSKFCFRAFLILTLLALCYLFFPALNDGSQTLWFSDGNMLQQESTVSGIRSFGTASWSQMFFLGNGNPMGAVFYPNWPLLAIFPLGVSLWLNIFLHIFLAAIGGWFCAKSLGIGPRGAAFSGIAFGLTSHFITLMGAGHIGKLQCIPWIPWTFGFFWLAWTTGRMRYFLLTALFYAPMWLSGEPQIPYYLGLYMFLMCLYYTALTIKTKPLSCVKTISNNIILSVLCLLTTILLSWQGISGFANLSTETKHSASITSDTEAENSQQKNEEDYDFSTGWSLPPEETAIFLTSMRLFGVKSPLYWGRMGTKDFHMTQVDHYMGVLVVLFAILALFKMRSNKITPFVLFMLISSLLIAYGCFTPIYRLIYSLPTMSAQRIPSRWIALTAFSFSMLAGIGFEQFTQLLEVRNKDKSKRYALLPIITAILSAGMLLSWIILNNSSSSLATQMFGANGLFPSGTLQIAQERTALFVSAFLNTGLLLLASTIILAWGLWISAKHGSSPAFPKLIRVWIIICLSLITFDLARNDKLYIEFFDWQSFYNKDGIIDFLQKDTDNYRVQNIAAQQHPYLNKFACYTAPWHRIKLTETPSWSRIWPEYQKLFDTLSSEKMSYRFHPRYYDIFGVKYVFSAVELPEYIKSFSKLSLLKEISFGNNVPPLFLYQYDGFVNDPMFVPSTQVLTNENDVLQLVTSPDFDLTKTVVGMNIPAISGKASGTAKLESFDNRTVKISTRSDGPGWIVFKIRYDANWKINIDGRPADIFKVNYLHCGIPVDAGQHTITMTYTKPNFAFVITFTGWCIAMVIVCLYYVLKLKKHNITAV